MKMLFPVLLLAVLLVSCAESPAPEEAPSAAPPSDFRLVLVLAIDQFRANYLDRFAPVLKGGLARLAERGVFFVDGHQDHAVTSTGPGHASISTGAYPSRSGIITNQWFDKQRRTPMYCVGDANWTLIGSHHPRRGRSPHLLQVSALPDWMKEQWPGSKVFTASYKDRAAILLGGHGADGAYWYRGGDFVTSTYYQTSYPEWVTDFNARNLPEQYFGRLWEPLTVDESVKKSLSIETTDFGLFERGFPHALGGRSFRPGPSFYSSFASSPMLDSFASSPMLDGYLAEFAKELIVQEAIGQDESPDYLGLSFSAPDLVGHSYGPNSPELLDTLIRLDGYLADLLDFIDQHIGLDQTLIALSADHGVCPMPESQRAKGLPGRRADEQDTVCRQNQLSEISTRLGVEAAWLLDDFYLDYELIEQMGLDPARVEKVAAEVLEECPVIRRIWTRTEMLTESDDPFHRLFKNSFHPERSPDLMPQLEEYQVTTSLGTSHGSPYRYDTHVPILFLQPGVAPKRVEGRVRTIDMAPTLAEILGLEIPLHVQGRSLVSYFKED